MDIPLNKKTLEKAIKESKNLNLAPIFLRSYINFNSNNKLLISQLLSQLAIECFEYINLLNENELNAVENSLSSIMKSFIDSKDRFIDLVEYKKALSIYYVIQKIHDNYIDYKEIINSDINNCDLTKTYPELMDKFNEDGLLMLDENFLPNELGIIYKNHLLFYHQFLRRNYSSNPNFDFTSILANYYKNNKMNSISVAVDLNRLMPKESYSLILEMDKWFGAPFDISKLDDINYIGLAILKRNKDSLFELTNHLDRTEFYWTYRNNLKTLQIEEISSLDYLFQNYYINRYIHTQRDVVNKKFIHLDGAVKIYNADAYSRFNTDLTGDHRTSKKQKLFRIDGDIEFDIWTDLITKFYKSNELIIEYFNPKAFNNIEERIRGFK